MQQSIRRVPRCFEYFQIKLLFLEMQNMVGFFIFSHMRTYVHICISLQNVYTHLHTYVRISFTVCPIDKLLEKSEWSSTHPLFLFHFLFYFLVTISDDGMKQLRDSGVIDLIVKELWIIKLIPKWHKVNKNT